MPRIRQASFVATLLMACWQGMMTAHELGHVAGAIASGGRVQRVVLHPLAISRTDVDPNPHRAVVVWLGPLVGCVLPLAAFLLMPARFRVARTMAGFFAGFCLIANGAYIAIGSFDRVGDCGEMLKTGTPLWILLIFGAITIPAGLAMWHRLGSLGGFLSLPGIVTWRMVAASAGAAVVLAAGGIWLSG